MQRFTFSALRRSALLCLLITTLVAAGCDLLPGPDTPRSPRTPTAVPPPTATVPPDKRGGTLTVSMAADVTSLNPWLAGNDEGAQKISRLIFNGLTRLDNRLQPQPDLAESWDVSADGTSLTFHLRKGVLWQDGKPFTAQDVVWSYNVVAALPVDPSSLLGASLVPIQQTIESVQAVDPVSYTVRFSLKRRYSPILADLALPILPSHILSGTTADKLSALPFNSNPVGTGPYAFDKRVPDQSVLLKSNPRYFAGEPPIGNINFLVAPPSNLALAEDAIRKGQLLLAQLPPADAEKLVKEGKGIRGGAYDELGYDFVAFNLRPPRPFSDTRLRQAWALALDKPGLTFAATAGEGDPVWSDINKASWAYDPNVPKPGGNPEAARKLLADAGWVDKNNDGILEKDGKPLQVSLYVRSDNPVRRKAAQAMVEPLKRVGIGVKVQLADFETALLGRLSPNAQPPFDFDVVMLGYTRTGVDPDDFLLFHSSQIPTQAAPAGLNFTGFNAPEYDDLSVKARNSYDFGERKDIYARMQSIIADQMPYYYLWAQKFGVVAGPKLKGDIDFSSPLYMWNITQWYIEK